MSTTAAEIGRGGVADEVTPPVGRRPTRRFKIGEGLEARQPPRLLTIGIFLAYSSVVVMRPGIPGKFAFVDPVIFLVCAYSLASMMHRGSPATSGAARLLPWIWLILLGSFLGLSSVGMANWALSNLARTMFALLTFVCFWHIVGAARLQRIAIYGTATGLAVTCVFFIIQPTSYRANALFIHPNYAGHFVAMAAFLLIVVSKRWYMKLLAVAALALGLQQTSSFGAMAMVIAMVGVYAFRVLTRNTAILAAALAVLAIGGLFLATPQAQDLVTNDDTSFTISESLSSDRLERSGDTRFILWSQALDAWAQEPWGIGPDGVRSRGVAVWRGHILEIHSDGLGYLVERGVIGLIGFLGLWATLFLLARKGGLARVLVVAMFVAGLFRETMHYRHMWLLLALAFAIDYATSEDDGSAAPRRGSPAGSAEGREGPDPAALGDRYFPGAPRLPFAPYDRTP